MILPTWEEVIDQYEEEDLFHAEERITGYRPGGFPPVSIGDIYNDRYEVFNKLGWGGFSTVWLAFDESTEEWVALKILRAEASQDSRELRAYQRLADLELSQPEEWRKISSLFVQLRDHFFHQGPNGNHLCLVTELLGPRLSLVLEKLSDDHDRWLSPDMVLKVARKLLEAIDVLHRSGFAHGDLNMNNIAFTCHRMISSQANEATEATEATEANEASENNEATEASENNEASEADELTGDRIWDEIAGSRCRKLVRRDGRPVGPSVPEEYVAAESWDDWNDEEFEDVKILDLGDLFSQQEQPGTCALPYDCRPPEFIFEDSFDHRSDLWQVGCASQPPKIYKLVFHMYPFMAMGENRLLVLTMMSILGDLPKEWIPRWESIQQDSDPKLPKLDPESTFIHTRQTNHSFFQVSSGLMVGSIPVAACALAECIQRMQISVH
ncbi:CMGC/SRPK protein kinase [Capronia epimyces CBS 606.96]|uniref:non-specific serine/threonine protein kinase n=1 Tax=Capronia epimyces CBS 606.96 TaxID=1182542 RepID=W9YA02_9EURO|nr:CMGC/SRPK protein kinase [Capronia epimyces CBS 606.96]EXJ86465.1 CMGC/SRPK protein kinase [Capronia epimyces CBS 606.96]